MEAPRLPSFMKINRIRRFDFKPRYYDERKERLDHLKKKYNDEGEKEVEFRDRLQESWSNRHKPQASGYPFGRLVLIMAFLFFLAYLLLFR